MIVCALEGAMLVARPYGGVERFQSAAEQLITGLTARITAVKFSRSPQLNLRSVIERHVEPLLDRPFPLQCGFEE